MALDAAATKADRPHTAPESTVTVEWFPPVERNGLTQLKDRAQVQELVRAARGNAQFWISRPNNHAQPIVRGAEAASLLASAGAGFATALVVPVYTIDASVDGPQDLTSLLGHKTNAFTDRQPTSYQVILSGTVGDTSFGLRPGTKRGEWLLDPNGELLNWGNSIDAVGRKVGFVAERAYITRTVFDLEGKPALYATWAVFVDANYKAYATALHGPPPIKATWTIAGQPLKLATVYETSAVFGPVTLTMTR